MPLTPTDHKIYSVIDWLIHNVGFGHKFTLGKLCKKLGLFCDYYFAITFRKTAVDRAHELALFYKMQNTYPLCYLGKNKDGVNQYAIV